MGGPASSLLDLYDEALPHVYGYLLARCGQIAVAEELTAETFLAAVDALRRDDPPPVSVAWLMGVARHKLVDHWRRLGREEAGLSSLSDLTENEEDPWDVRLDAVRARSTLAVLAPQHRAVLTLRYLDDLPVKEVAFHLNRTPHATEGLLSRARDAFRRAYCTEGRDDA
jgi:RNA polymerase sigma-70 factor (ECF subfamily)